MLFFKSIITAATIQSVLSCPAAKKSNLRNEGMYVSVSLIANIDID